MQIAIKALDGTLKRIETLGEYEPQALIDHITAVSNEDDGYHVYAGDNLEDNPTREVYHVVASAGVLICQNVLDPA